MFRRILARVVKEVTYSVFQSTLTGGYRPLPDPPRAGVLVAPPGPKIHLEIVSDTQTKHSGMESIFVPSILLCAVAMAQGTLNSGVFTYSIFIDRIIICYYDLHGA